MAAIIWRIRGNSNIAGSRGQCARSLEMMTHTGDSSESTAWLTKFTRPSLDSVVQRKMEQVFLAQNPEAAVQSSHFGVRKVEIPAADDQAIDSKINQWIKITREKI